MRYSFEETQQYYKNLTHGINKLLGYKCKPSGCSCLDYEGMVKAMRAMLLEARLSGFAPNGLERRAYHVINLWSHQFYSGKAQKVNRKLSAANR